MVGQANARCRLLDISFDSWTTLYICRVGKVIAAYCNRRLHDMGYRVPTGGWTFGPPRCICLVGGNVWMVCDKAQRSVA